MSSISVQTNVKDRVFVILNGKVWERRYFNGSWNWIEHKVLNSLLRHPLALGPCMINTEENIGRLFVLKREGWASGAVDMNTYETLWVMYDFDPQVLDYSPTAPPGSYNVSSSKSVAAVSNLTVSADWKLYGMSAWNRPGTDEDRRVGLSRFDIDLNLLEISPFESDPFFSEEHEEAENVYITESQAKFARPSVMSNHDVFFNTRGILHHANINMAVSQHWDRKRFHDISDAFDDMCFGLRRNGRLFARRYDSGKDKWVWDDHGRPIKKCDFKDEYRVGSLRKFNDGVLFAIKPKWSDQFRVYHRWRDENGDWHWADHGYPNDESIVHIGPAFDDKFFVVTASSKLYERNWNHGTSNWAWEDHGSP